MKHYLASLTVSLTLALTILTLTFTTKDASASTVQCSDAEIQPIGSSLNVSIHYDGELGTATVNLHQLGKKPLTLPVPVKFSDTGLSTGNYTMTFAGEEFKLTISNRTQQLVGGTYFESTLEMGQLSETKNILCNVQQFEHYPAVSSSN